MRNFGQSEIILSLLFCEICLFPLVLVIVQYFSQLLIVFRCF
jgi:hypothetical protein